MLLTVDGPSTEPYYLRIAAGLRKAIAAGALAPGAKLPTARELGATLGVNVHTVLRSYALLRDEALLDMGRGRGVRVSEGSTQGRARLAELTESLVAEARRWGLGPDDAAGMVRAAME
ncbi:MAG: GntR family transcriptional regulator [Acidimicrobiales bacterium]